MDRMFLLYFEAFLFTFISSKSKAIVERINTVNIMKKPVFTIEKSQVRRTLKPRKRSKKLSNSGLAASMAKKAAINNPQQNRMIVFTTAEWNLDALYPSR